MALIPAATAAGDVPGRAFAMLEAAQRTADETVATAKAEADTILVKAREEASKVTGKLDEQRAALDGFGREWLACDATRCAGLRDHLAHHVVRRFVGFAVGVGVVARARLAAQPALLTELVKNGHIAFARSA